MQHGVDIVVRVPDTHMLVLHDRAMHIACQLCDILKGDRLIDDLEAIRTVIGEVSLMERARES